jgi:hypothetical protein
MLNVPKIADPLRSEVVWFVHVAPGRGNVIAPMVSPVVQAGSV